jgi:AcrR family transcriptional regulator
MEDAPELPREVALLWGRRPAGRRGRRPTLGVDEITAAAVRIADAEGLGAVSMARVAKELGNSTMALYRHVESKDELLLLMSDAALEPPPDLTWAGDWRAQLGAWAAAVLGMIRKHPWYREIPLTGPPIGPKNLAWFDSALGSLDGTDLDEEGKVAVVTGLLPLVHGQARLSIDLSAGFAEDPESFGAGYAAALAAVVDPIGFPALSRVLAAGVFGPGGPGADRDAPAEGFDALDAEFRFALDCYFDGVEAFMARGATGGR